MNLIVNNTEAYQLILALNVNYEAETISAIVTFWDREKHTVEKKAFPEGMFSSALACYRSYENTYFKTKGEA